MLCLPRAPRPLLLGIALSLTAAAACQGSHRVTPPPEGAGTATPEPRPGPQGAAAVPAPEPEGATPIPAAVPAGAPQAAVAPSPPPPPLPEGARIFDHRHADLGRIPAKCAQALTSSQSVIHYGHRSHGSQILVGAKTLQQAHPAFKLAAGYTSVPRDPGALKIWDGMLKDNAVKPEDYWASDAGVAELRKLLKAHPEIRYSMWAWSSEISRQSEQDIKRYLDTLDALGREFPKVTFIYMTGPADEAYQGANRAQRNQQIREHCLKTGKVLFDFEDLDAWYGGQRHTAVVEGVEIPMEHPRYSVKTPGNKDHNWTHTTLESCENKARAFFWMMAKLEGCELP